MDRFAWVWCLMHQSEVDVCTAKGDRGLHRIDGKKESPLFVQSGPDGWLRICQI